MNAKNSSGNDPAGNGQNNARRKNKGPHDMGGDRAGAIDISDHGMARWHKQCNGLRMSVVRNKLTSLDELRRAAEDLGEEYNRLDYFERLVKAAKIVLIEKDFITEDELSAKMFEIRARNSDAA